MHLSEHDLFGKPVPTFPDHALGPSCPDPYFQRQLRNLRRTLATYALEQTKPRDIEGGSRDQGIGDA